MRFFDPAVLLLLRALTALLQLPQGLASTVYCSAQYVAMTTRPKVISTPNWMWDDPVIPVGFFCFVLFLVLVWFAIIQQSHNVGLDPAAEFPLS